MPPRLSKRQQREQEEEAALAATLPNRLEPEASADEEESIIIPQRPTAFAALALGDGSAPEDSEEETTIVTSKKSKKKKKKKAGPWVAAAAATSPPLVVASPQKEEASPAGLSPLLLSKKQRKAAKKGKTKESSGDEVDKALAELSLTYPSYKNAAASIASRAHQSQSQSLSSLLVVSPQHLDAELEMRKFFGAKVISAFKSTSPGSSSRRPPAAAAARSTLTRPQSTWWPHKLREGLSIRLLSPEESADKLLRNRINDDESANLGAATERWWTVEYSKKYKSVTMAFIQTVMAGDPDNFWRILSKMPYHADTLLQMSEVYRHREEYSQSVDFVDRALFSYERAFVGAFNFTSGANRLDFDRVENRPFFLALHRQVADLQRRGCPRTSFELARLLLALDPYTDPHGSLFHLEYLAIKTDMGQWLLDLSALYDNAASSHKSEKRGSFDVASLPGWAYSKALALRAWEVLNKVTGHHKSTNALKQAMVSFPSAIPLIADKADISLSSSVRAHPACRIHTDDTSLSLPEAMLHLLSHLYAQRASQLYKEDQISAWFSQTAEEALPSLVIPSQSKNSLYLRFTSHFTASANPALAFSIFRHVNVLESSLRRLYSFIPRAALQTKQLACDPLPPPPAILVSAYDDEFFRGIEDLFSYRPRGRGSAADQRNLERMIPDPVFRGQLQAMFDGNPALRERFPQGVMQFAQLAAQLPEDALIDLFMQAQGEVGGNDRMPGEFVDFVDPFNEEEEIEDAEDPDDGHLEHPVVAAHRDGSDHEEGEEDEDEDEDIAPLPVRMLRNIVNRFWGGGGAPDQDSSDDEDGLPDLG